jgi:hypothetical protein
MFRKDPFCGKTFNKRQNMNEHIKAHEINNNNGKDAAGSQVHVCPFEQCRATCIIGHTRRKEKTQKTQYVLDTTMRKQTQIK